MKSLSVEHQHGNGHNWDRVTNEERPTGESKLPGATGSEFIPIPGSLYPYCKALSSILEQ